MFANHPKGLKNCPETTQQFIQELSDQCLREGNYRFEIAVLDETNIHQWYYFSVIFVCRSKDMIEQILPWNLEDPPVLVYTTVYLSHTGSCWFIGTDGSDVA